MGTVVMVVDDSLLVRQQVKRALVGAGYDVVEAVDGVDALEKSATAGPALIICDVNMPRMSGIDFLEGLRAREKSASTPVVMLTTEGQPDLIRRAQALGAKGWITKPFKAELLLAAANKLVGGK